MNAQQPPGRRGPRWRAPAADGPLRASVTLPGSKSMTNRALVLAALADGPGAITRPLRERNQRRMRQIDIGRHDDVGIALGGCQRTRERAHDVIVF